MQAIHFETTVKDGYIKVPRKYSGLNNRKVIVDISDTAFIFEEKDKRVARAKRFLRKCSGIIKDGEVPADITIKDIRSMRLNETYDQ